MKRLLIIGAFFAGAALLAPVATADNPHDKRYYHKGGHDYHVYNNQEDRAYRVYLGEQHRDYRDFRRVNSNEREQYFTWRHSHPDNTLFKVEIR